MSDEDVIVRISFVETVKIYLYAVIYSLWICLKTLFRWIWRYNASSKIKSRETPPPVLVDASVGSHNYVKIQGVKLHYVESGSRSSPCILLLHGFPDCWVGWRRQVGTLSASHRVVALDLPGCGDSDRPASRLSYSLPRLLGLLKAVLEWLRHTPKQRPITVIAHDLGGLLAWYLAHESPELIDRLVVVSSPHPNVFWDSLPTSSPFNTVWMYIAQVPFLPEYEAQKGDLMLLEKCYPHLVGKQNSTNSSSASNHSPASVLEAYKYVFSRMQDWTGPINYYRNLIFWRVSEKKEKIRMPVLLIIGNKDPQVSLEAIVRSSAWCSQATMKIVEGTGHFPHQESPGFFNKLLQDYLLGDIIVPVNKPGLSVGAARGLVGRMLGAVHLFT